jgi:hypothetical protein
MQLVEQHLIRKSDPRFAAIDEAAFASKNLYNQATYQMRQAFIYEGKYLSLASIFHRVKHLDCYQALPRKVSNSILILIDKNWRSFRNGLKEWYEHPEKFTGKPRIPGYKPKERGRNILIYDKQALGKRAFKKTGKIVPSGLGMEIDTKIAWEDIDCVRIVVSTVAQICRQTWTKAVSVALGQSGLPVFLPHSSRFSPQVVSSKRCRLEHRPVGPTGAPPLCRVCSFAYGPGLDQRDCPPQPSSIRPVAGQSVFSRSSLGAAANETRERSCDAR